MKLENITLLECMHGLTQFERVKCYGKAVKETLGNPRLRDVSYPTLLYENFIKNVVERYQEKIREMGE